MGTIKGTSKTSVFRFDPDDERLVLITDPTHRLYDKRVELPLNEAMVESIAREGVLQPIKIRKAGDTYEVVFGRQRVRAAREAAKRYPDRKIVIPAIPATLNDIEALVHATIENVQRTDDPPSIRGFNAARLRDRGYSDEELEAMFGVTIGTINDWISFSESATDEVKRAVDAGEITYTQARKISRKKLDKQVEALASEIRDEKPRPGQKKGQKKLPTLRIVASVEREGVDVVEGIDVKISGLKTIGDTELILITERIYLDLTDEIESRENQNQKEQ
jgi:ParB family chromosome partitioning protein